MNCKDRPDPTRTVFSVVLSTPFSGHGNSDCPCAGNMGSHRIFLPDPPLDKRKKILYNTIRKYIRAILLSRELTYRKTNAPERLFRIRTGTVPAEINTEEL